MTSQNVENLLTYVLAHRVGTKFTCATSQYAENTTAPGFRFDTWSTAQAVRSLVKRGFIEAECGWRYYDCKVIRHHEGKFDTAKATRDLIRRETARIRKARKVIDQASSDINDALARIEYLTEEKS